MTPQATSIHAGQPRMTKSSGRLQRWIDNILDMVEGTIDTKTSLKGCDHDITVRPITWFSPVEPLSGSGSDECLAPGYDRGFFMDACPVDVVDWDISLMRKPTEEDEKIGMRTAFHRFRRVPLRELRGVPIRSSWIGASTRGFLGNDGQWFCVELLYNWVNGTWQRLHPHRWKSRGALSIGNMPEVFRRTDEEEIEELQLMLGVAFTRDYEWTVRLGRPGGMQVNFVTDPTGARTVFKLREAPTIESRRAALKNWVREHWRQSRKDPGEESRVRSHLRGATRFSWSGLDCEIVPSAYDLKKNEESRIAREQEIALVREWASKRYGDKAMGWQATAE